MSLGVPSLGYSSSTFDLGLVRFNCRVVCLEGVNRSVGDCVIKIMGVVHVRSHRWPSTIRSILSRTAYVLFKGTALGVRHGRDASTV